MRRRDFLGVCGAATAATAFPIAPALAEDEANMGVIAGGLILGDEPPWKGSYQDGFYLLEDPEGFNNIMTMFTKMPAPVTKIQLDVFVVGNAGHSGAGLLLNREASASNPAVAGSWLGVTVEPTGTLGIYFYSQNDGVRRLTQFPNAGARDGYLTRLSCQNSPEGIDILTNDVKCGHFSDVKLNATAGLLFTDIGHYYLQNFVVE